MIPRWETSDAEEGIVGRIAVAAFMFGGIFGDIINMSLSSAVESVCRGDIADMRP